MIEVQIKEENNSKILLPKAKKWPTKRLGDICNDIYRYPSFYGMEHLSKGIPVIRGEHINNKGEVSIDWSDYWFVSTEVSQEFPRTILQKGDLVFTVRGTIGKVGIIRQPHHGAQLSPNLIRISPEASKVDSLYLWYYLQMIKGTQDAVIDNAVTVATVKASDLTELKIPLPSLSEQRSITDFIKKQMSANDKAKAATETQLEAARTLPAAYLREMFNSPEARKWPKKLLGEHVEKIGSGLTPRGGQSAYLDSGIPLIRSQNVHLNRFEPLGLVHISNEQDESMKNSRVFKGDVLLNITGASIGRVCCAPVDICPANVNQHVSIIRPKRHLDPEFLALFLSSPDFQQFVMNAQAGATRQALTKAMIENFVVPVPQLTLQREIVRRIFVKLKQVEKTFVILKNQYEIISHLMKPILIRAFNGAV